MTVRGRQYRHNCMSGSHCLRPAMTLPVYVLLLFIAGWISQPAAAKQADSGTKANDNPGHQPLTAKRGAISMCVDPDWMPLERIRDGRHIGIAADFMGLIESRTGVPIELVPTESWPQSIDMAKQRICDIFSLAMATPDREEYMRFTSPYFSSPLVLATRSSEPFIADVTLIHDKPLGVVRGYAFGELLRRNYPEMLIQDVDSIGNGLDLVEEEHIYGFIGTLATVGYALQRDHPELKIAGKFDQKWELGIGVRNDNPILFDLLERAVNSISPAERQAIMNKWISVRYDREIDYQLILSILAILLLVIAFQLYRQRLLHIHNLELQRLSETDYLTGVWNRKKLDQLLDEQAALFGRYQTLFSILLIDFDHFKKINDRHGHAAGDRALIEITELIRGQIRATDYLGRWGGEEFIVICPNTDKDGAGHLAELLRNRIANYEFRVIGKQTASFGVAGYSHVSSVESMVASADDALYQAKSSGRNRVAVA